MIGKSCKILILAIFLRKKIRKFMVVTNFAVSFYERNTCICNLRHTEKGVELRIVADEKPAPEAVSVPTNLEDLYMFYFAEELSGASSDSARRP